MVGQEVVGSVTHPQDLMVWSKDLNHVWDVQFPSPGVLAGDEIYGPRSSPRGPISMKTGWTDV